MENTDTIKPIRIVNGVAPIRICDNGGWTDTWFAEHGKIFNIGVYPFAEVQVEVFPPGSTEERIVINAENFGERYAFIFSVTYQRHFNNASSTKPIFKKPS